MKHSMFFLLLLNSTNVSSFTEMNPIYIYICVCGRMDKQKHNLKQKDKHSWFHSISRLCADFVRDACYNDWICIGWCYCKIKFKLWSNGKEDSVEIGDVVSVSFWNKKLLVEAFIATFLIGMYSKD